MVALMVLCAAWPAATLVGGPPKLLLRVRLSCQLPPGALLAPRHPCRIEEVAQPGATRDAGTSGHPQQSPFGTLVAAQRGWSSFAHSFPPWGGWVSPQSMAAPSLSPWISLHPRGGWRREEEGRTSAHSWAWKGHRHSGPSPTGESLPWKPGEWKPKPVGRQPLPSCTI